MLGRRRTRYPSLMPSSSRRTNEDHIHRTRPSKPEAPIGWRPARSPFVLSMARRRICRSPLVPHPHCGREAQVGFGPLWRPRADKCITGCVCNSLFRNDSLYLHLWEYSGDKPSTRGQERLWQGMGGHSSTYKYPRTVPVRAQINRAIVIPRWTLQTLSPFSRWIYLPRRASPNTWSSRTMSKDIG
jgi:hypothetical protein